jgi:hypothetical protein
MTTTRRRFLIAVGIPSLLVRPARVSGQETEKKPVAQLYYSTYLGENRDFVRLDILRSGRVYYHFAPEPSTNSGGMVVHKDWPIPEKEAAALLDALDTQVRKLKTNARKGAGTHHLKLGDRLNDNDEQLEREVFVAALPAAVANQLLSLLQKGHPELWKKKQPGNWKTLP